MLLFQQNIDFMSVVTFLVADTYPRAANCEEEPHLRGRDTLLSHQIGPLQFFGCMIDDLFEVNQRHY